MRTTRHVLSIATATLVLALGGLGVASPAAHADEPSSVPSRSTFQPGPDYDNFQPGPDYDNFQPGPDYEPFQPGYAPGTADLLDDLLGGIGLFG